MSRTHIGEIVLIDAVLVVCVGNICRSPVGAGLLSAKLAEVHQSISVDSAGIAALVGRGADPVAAGVALEHGLSLKEHQARQFTPQMGKQYGLILVMEHEHRQHILTKAPQLAGRIMLYDHWTGARGIPDPYQLSREFHDAVYIRIDDAAKAWVRRLARRGERSV